MNEEVNYEKELEKMNSEKAWVCFSNMLQAMSGKQKHTVESCHPQSCPPSEGPAFSFSVPHRPLMHGKRTEVKKE